MVNNVIRSGSAIKGSGSRFPQIIVGRDVPRLNGAAVELALLEQLFRGGAVRLARAACALRRGRSRPSGTSIRSCSSSIDSGSRSCRASCDQRIFGLAREEVFEVHVRIVDPCGRGVNKRGAVPSIPASMMAVVAPQPDGAEELALVERPVPKPGPGEVLIKVAAAGVNRPDILQRRGLYPPPPGAPDILGLEIAGEVVACGRGGRAAHRRKGLRAGRGRRLCRILRRACGNVPRGSRRRSRWSKPRPCPKPCSPSG